MAEKLVYWSTVCNLHTQIILNIFTCALGVALAATLDVPAGKRTHASPETAFDTVDRP